MADNVEIQGLEFQIQENSEGAVSGINNLKKALSGLKGATGASVTGLNATSKSIRELKNALSGLNSGDVSKKLTQIATGLKALESAKNIKISSSIANQLNALNAALANVRWTDGDKLRTLADGLRPLSELGKANMTTFINQLKKLPTVIEELEKADIDKFTQQMKELAAAMKPFADEMQKVSNGFSAFPSRIQRLIRSTEQYNNTVRRATNSTSAWGKVANGLKFGTMIYGLSRLASMIGTAITKSNEYQENLNLFTVAMGEYAQEAFDYGQTVSEVLGIDLSDWIRNQGVFNTLLTGFGDTAERAALMSKNLTQLGYDLSSFFNISVEDAMQKLQSGISGELEPLRRLGYDLSQARLEATALSLGIDKSVQSMTQAEKAELRYYAIMTQVTTAQGDLARTLEAPANQLRVLSAQFNMAARSIGNIFIPALNAILPYAIAVVQVIREIADAIASLFGFELTEVDYSGITAGASGAGSMADSLDEAAGAAKKLKQYTAGFDELNVFAPDSGSAGSGVGAGGGNGFDFELPEYDFLGDAVSTRIDEIRAKMEPFVTWIKDNMAEILETVAAIGTAMLQWKVANGILGLFNTVKGLSGKNLLYNITFAITGLGLFLDGWDKIKEAIEDILDNGPNLTNVTQLISGFAEGLGVAFLALGNVKLAGASLVISGLSGIVSSISDMVNNGVNFDNATNLVRNLGIFLSGIGLLTNNPVLTGGGLALTGITLIVRNLADVMEAFRTGDWSGVDKVELAAGLLLTVGGFLTAIGTINQITSKIGAGKAVTSASTALQEVTNAMGNSAGGGLNGTLKSLAQSLGWGLVVVAEVAAAAVLIVGAIAILGVELDQVGKAWEPVIENGETVATAIFLGTNLLIGVGLAAYALGTGGVAIATNVGLGTAILLELGVATGLFIVEVWAIGKGLDEIGQAWQPVIDNGETIATGIGVGTGLLVGIGVVTAALGAATVASAGLLPVAVGLGTAILVELAAAFVAFTASLVSVADELTFNLAPALTRVNGVLPALTVNMSNFVDFMSTFAGEIGSYTDSMGGITWDSIVSGFQQLFAGNPIGDFADDVADIATDTANLNAQLVIAVPELRQAVSLVTQYSALIDQLESLLNDREAVVLSGTMFVNMQEVGVNLVTGFASGMNSQAGLLNESFATITNGIQLTYTTMLTTIQTQTTTTWLNIYTVTITQWTTISTYLTTTWTTLTTTWTTTMTTLQTGWSTGWTQMTTGWNTFSTTFQASLTTFSTQTTTKWSTMWTQMTTTWTTWQTEFMTGYTTFETEFSSAWYSMWRGMTNTTIIQWNSVLTVMEKAMNNAISALNDVIRSINAVAWITGISLSYFSEIQLDRIQYMAQGGFVDEGQLFIAREAGAEMVGAIGNRTAVANNDQIVEAVSAGVSNANDGVIAAIYALMNIIEDKDLSVSIGDDVIGRSYDRYSRNRGVRVNSGAFSNAY